MSQLDMLFPINIFVFSFFRFTGGDISLACSAMCDCDKNKFSPICGSDGLTYFSSCFAGCNSSHIENGKTQFSNCACVQPGTLFIAICIRIILRAYGMTPGDNS